ncbi:uncharacterized protein [Miscanthus floridulus]|uniref:uncharacterized protein n=1 Tax=Miscanthus floridulus TaxID=154761 RepID=UPI00345B1960
MRRLPPFPTERRAFLPACASRGFFKKASELSPSSAAPPSSSPPPASRPQWAPPSVERVISRFAPLPSDSGDDYGDRDSEGDGGHGATGRRRPTRAWPRRKTRMGAVGEKADAEALGEEELREFARKLHRLRGANVRRRADKLQVAPASQPMMGLQ